MRYLSLTRSWFVLTTVCLICGYLYWADPRRLRSSFGSSLTLSKSPNSTANAPNPPAWPRTIWQTSKVPVQDLYGEEREHYETWPEMNPGYRHELMTDEKMAQYVREKYGGTEIEEIYFEVKDYILLSDLIRYLILLEEGGVYNDLDVGCERSVDDWLPKEFDESAGVVLGVEVDNKFGPDGRTFENGEDLFELVNWTIMAKPGQPFMRFLVQRVLDNLRKMAERQQTSIRHMKLHSIQEVLQTTGPAAMTVAFFDYATNVSHAPVTYKNFTKIEEPKMVGEVVILPIHAFGAGHQVEWAGLKQDESKVLVHHYFSGSWYTDHVWDPPTKTDDHKDEGDEDNGGPQEAAVPTGNAAKRTGTKEAG